LPVPLENKVRPDRRAFVGRSARPGRKARVSPGLLENRDLRDLLDIAARLEQLVRRVTWSSVRLAPRVRSARPGLKGTLETPARKERMWLA
jgi:hypothetical protein